MPIQRNELNYSGQNIYAGIDVHLKSWNVTILTEELHHKTFTQSASASALCEYLHRNFPNATYHSAYEAGFSGFHTHYKLKKMGIKNIVINAADVPGTQKDRLQKRDAVDSNKIARALRAGQLVGIHVPEVSTLEARSLLRLRETIVKDLSCKKQQVKSMLYFYGIAYPEEFTKSTTHWSKRFMDWLSEEVTFTTAQGRAVLEILLRSIKEKRALLLDVERKIRRLSENEKYASDLQLLRTVPGIGLITGMTFLTDVEDIKRFSNADRFAGYVGIIPTSHSSGEKDIRGEMTPRGRSRLRTMLIESAWTAARTDPALSLCYSKLVHRMEPNKAISRIARKLLNRIFYVLKYKREYVCSVVK
jgi:transposase